MKPSIFWQGLLLLLFGLIFLILCVITLASIGQNCPDLTESTSKTSQNLIIAMIVPSLLIMGLGFLGILNFKHHLLDDDSFTFFYKYIAIMIGIINLVCSSYLVSIINSFNCIDENAISTIKNTANGMLWMSILYFPVSVYLTYKYNKETDEDIINAAESTSKEVTSYNEDSVKDIRLVDRYKDQIEKLEKANSLVDLDTQIDYNHKIDKLRNLIYIANNRNTAKELYLKIKNMKLEDQVKQINLEVCDAVDYEPKQKVDLLKEMNKLNNKLKQEECKDTPQEFKTKTEKDRLQEELDKLEIQNKIALSRAQSQAHLQNISAQSSPNLGYQQSLLRSPLYPQSQPRPLSPPPSPPIYPPPSPQDIKNFGNTIAEQQTGLKNMHDRLLSLNDSSTEYRELLKNYETLLQQYNSIH